MVHELAQLRRAKEFTNSRRRWLRVDQVLRHYSVDFDRGHTLFDRALHTKQAYAVLVFHQFANGTHTTVTKVVNIVDIAFAVAQMHERFDTCDDVFFAKCTLRIFRIEVQTHVHFHAAHRGKVITL